MDWNLDLRRRLGNEEVVEWNDLQEALELAFFPGGEDEVIWAGPWRLPENSQLNLCTGS